MIKVNQFIRSMVGCALLFVLAACATTSGPTYIQMQSNLTPLAADMGRIYVYRTSSFGGAVQPSVMLDGAAIGKAVPQGYFFVDRPRGTYKITTETEVERSASFTLEPGQTRYVRLDPSFGFFIGHISPVLVDQAQAENEIKDTHYMGS